MIKKEAKQPVTFCENYLPWLDKLKGLVEAVDFISIHTYPVWEYKSIEEALQYTEQNYKIVYNLPKKMCTVKNPNKFFTYKIFLVNQHFS